jgi:mannose-1-phosphate guanylyltransferase
LERLEEHFYAVIMAGGGGTRLWPLSRQARPKQMLPLIGDQTLFQDTISRLKGLFPYDRVFIVTTAELALAFQAQCPEIPADNYLLEPQPRGTASVVGLAAAALQQRDPFAVTAILTSDHYIGDNDRFQILLRAALEIAQKDFLVTLGVAPTYPATGFGYIQQGEKLGIYNGLEAFQVKQFKEKPDSEQAMRMVASGDYSWNSGMFVWRVQAILSEFQRQMPALHDQLTTIGESWYTSQKDAVLRSVWPQIEVNTIDYGIMEGARNVVVIPATGLHWNDVGTWESMFEILTGDDHGNIILPHHAGQTLAIDTENTLIHVSESNRLIVTIGLSDIVIVDTGDALLVSRKDQAQKVRQVVAQLKANQSPLA